MFISSSRLLSNIIADEFQCAVCSGTLSDPLINPGCGHRYCTTCIRDSLVRCGNTCPNCRDYIECYSSLRRDLNFEGLLSKLQNLQNVLKFEEKSLEDSVSKNDSIGGSTAQPTPVCSSSGLVVHVLAVDPTPENKSNAISNTTTTTSIPQQNTSNKRKKQQTQVVPNYHGINTNGAYARFMNLELKLGPPREDSSPPPAPGPAPGPEPAPPAASVLSAALPSPPPAASVPGAAPAPPPAAPVAMQQHFPVQAAPNNAYYNPYAAYTYAMNYPGATGMAMHRPSPTPAFTGAASNNTPILDLTAGSPKNDARTTHAANCSTTKSVENSPFGEWFKDLVAFKSKHGHCDVGKSPFPDDNRLALWCDSIRKSQCNTAFAKDHMQLLNSIGFNWWIDKSEVKFNERFAQLIAYKDVYGHCNPPQTTSSGYCSLAMWCKNNRKLYTEWQDNGSQSKDLSVEQMQKLDGIGFEWIRDRSSAKFDDRFSQLCSFKEKFGHCNVPRSAHQEHYTLWWWCYEIRSSRKELLEGKKPTKPISDEHVRRLDSIGFIW